MKSPSHLIWLIALIVLPVLIFSVVNVAQAHPGRTDSSGGHYCWTNCASWGYSYGQYHYHGGYSFPSTSFNYTPPATKQYYYGCEISGDFNRDALGNFTSIYQEAVGRGINCDELNFHNDRVTPHEVLRNWLYSLVRDRTDAITDIYLQAINRKPRNDELQFHLSHKTPISRLKAVLFRSTERRQAIIKLYEKYGRTASEEDINIHINLYRTPLDKLINWLETNQR